MWCSSANSTSHRLLNVLNHPLIYCVQLNNQNKVNFLILVQKEIILLDTQLSPLTFPVVYRQNTVSV